MKRIIAIFMTTERITDKQPGKSCGFDLFLLGSRCICNCASITSKSFYLIVSGNQIALHCRPNSFNFRCRTEGNDLTYRKLMAEFLFALEMNK